MAAFGLEAIALVLMALAAAGFLANRLRLPVPLGFLVAGIALAPATVGRTYVPQSATELGAELGVLVLLFLIGLELDLRRLRSSLRTTARVLPFDLAIPAVAVAGLARIAGWDFRFAAALGLAATSSTLFGERLTAGPRVSTGARHRVLGVLVAEDMGGAVLLALLVLLASPVAEAQQAAGLMASAWTIVQMLFWLIVLAGAALLVIPRVLDEVARHHQHDLMVMWSLGFLVLWGYLGHLVGSAELGALLAGVAAAEAGSQFVVRNSLTGVRDIALAVFFFASGLLVDLGSLMSNLGWVLLVAGVYLAAKFVVHSSASMAAGLGVEGSLQTAFALGTVGEFSLIIVAVAQREGIAHPQLQNTVIGAMVVLLLVASTLMPRADRLARRLHRLPPTVRRPLSLMTRALRREGHMPTTTSAHRRMHVRNLVANLILLVAWGAFGAWLSRRGAVTIGLDLWMVVVVVGLHMAVSAVLLWGAYRGYRAWVWELVGPGRGESPLAGKVRARIVDTVVVVALVLAAIAFTLRSQQTVPVLIGGGAVAIIVASLTWRQLRMFQRTLEHSIGRVLGDDAEAEAVLDQIAQTYPWGVRFAAVAIPDQSPLVGQTIEESRLGHMTGANVAVLQRRGHEVVSPPPETRLRSGDTLVIMGDQHQIERAEALIVAHGDALRMTARSKTALVEEIEIEENSPWSGQTLQDLDIKDETGALVVGVWSKDAAHPHPFRPSEMVKRGDRIILLGGPLQLERARQAAAPPERGDPEFEASDGTPAP